MRHPLMAVVLLAAGLLVMGGRPAAADTRTEKAREHYLQGDAYYKLDKYAEALHEYEQAYIAKPDPSFLYNIAQCHRLMGDRSEALKFYRRYLKDAPVAPNRAIAEKHIHELETSLSHPPAETREPAARAPVVAPAPPAPVMPPPVETTPPKQVALAAPPPVEPAGPATLETAPKAESERSHPFYTRWWFWTAVGVVAVGALLLGVSASHDPACPPGSVCK